MKKKIFVLLALILGSYLVFSLGRQVFLLFQAKGRISLAEQKLASVQAEQEKLKNELEYRESNEFVEEEARNRLGLAKEGETIVILPEKLQAEAQGSQNTASQKPSNISRWFERLF